MKRASQKVADAKMLDYLYIVYKRTNKNFKLSSEVFEGGYRFNNKTGKSERHSLTKWCGVSNTFSLISFIENSLVEINPNPQNKKRIEIRWSGGIPDMEMVTKMKQWNYTKYTSPKQKEIQDVSTKDLFSVVLESDVVGNGELTTDEKIDIIFRKINELTEKIDVLKNIIQ